MASGISMHWYACVCIWVNWRWRIKGCKELTWITPDWLYVLCTFLHLCFNKRISWGLTKCLKFYIKTRNMCEVQNLWTKLIKLSLLCVIDLPCSSFPPQMALVGDTHVQYTSKTSIPIYYFSGRFVPIAILHIFLLYWTIT